MTEILQSFLKPVHQRNASLLEKKAAFKEAILFILKGWGIFVLVLFADASQKELTNVSLLADFVKANRLFDHAKGLKFFLFVSFIGPILEELTFRSFMDRSRLMIAVSIGFLGLTFMRFSDLVTHQYKWPIELTASFGVGLISFAILRKMSFTFQDSHFRIVFFLMNAMFVGLHIGNYDLNGLQTINFVFFPIILLPQIILTIALSYVRLKSGLLWAIALHMLNNLLPALFMFFKLS